MNLRKVILSILCGTVLLASAACAKTTANTEKAEEKPVPVKVQKVDTGEISVDYTYAARLKPEKQVSVIPEVSGKVLAVYFDIGDKVEKGDTLFRIDEEAIRDSIKDVEKQLEAVNLNIEMQELGLSSAKDGQYRQQLLQLEQQVSLAEIAYDSAKKSYEDIKNLHDTGTAPTQQLNQAETAFKQAEVSLQSAKENYELYKTDLSPTSIESKEKQLEQTRIQKEQLLLSLDNLKKTFGKTAVKSPISGIIASRNVEENQMVNAQLPPFTVIQTANLFIEVGVSEKVVSSIQVGDSVSIALDNKAPVTGEIYAMAPAADERTHTYLTKIKVNNEDGTIKPGMFAEVSFTVENRNDILVVPINSVLSDSNGSYVYTAGQDQTAIKTTVQTGMDNGTHIEITNGLGVGDLLIVEGQNYVEDGGPITMVE